MWLLTIEDYEGLTTFHRLVGERYTLGRATDRDLVLAQLDVSRRQGRLERQGEGWAYVDEGSAFGSYVNCARVHAHEPVLLDEKAVLRCGDYVLRLTRSELEADPAPRYVEPARLRALSGALAGVEHVFGRDELVTVGRSDESTLRVMHVRVSDTHALIRPRVDGRHELVDASDNGLLFVNGRQVEWAEHVLEGGDAINVGGVALFRYLAPSRQPDPRLDERWGDGAGLPEVEAARPSAPRACAAPPVGDETLPDNRAVVAGLRPLPAPRPPSASFQRLRRVTVGQALRGPVVAPRGAAPGPAPPSGLASPSRAAARPSPSAPAGAPRSEGAASETRAGAPSVHSLAALEAPVSAPAARTAAAPASPPAEASPDAEGAPAAERPLASAPRRHQALRSGALWAAAIGLGLFGASTLRAPPGPGAAAAAGEPPAARVPPPGPIELARPASAPPAARGSASAATGVAVSKPSAAASAPPAAPKRNAALSRAALEARLRAGRASAREVHELLLLCQREGDARCIANARAALPSGAPP